MNRLSLVVLAAGSSRRFGKVKQLADIGGVPMLQRVVDQCREIRGVDLYVALGANSDEIQAQIKFGKAGVLYSPNWSDGVGATIASVAVQLEGQYEGMMLVAGDQPLLGPSRLEPMINGWLVNRDLACCAKYDNVLGIPAIFPERLFEQLKALRGDSGARKLLLAEGGKLQVFPIPEAEVDIDHPEDMEKLPIII
ncbi:MAG: nucleotidyltransferase family protein [Pseudomonadales bacterium]